MKNDLNNDNIISNALNDVSDRHIRKSELDLITRWNGRVKRKPSKFIRFALTAACVAAVCGIGLTAGAAATNGFTKTKGYDNLLKRPTISFSAASSDGCPDTIEQFYTLTELPSGTNYPPGDVYLNDEKTELIVTYIQEPEDMYNDPFLFLKTVKFFQSTKAEFSAKFETPEFVEVSETTVNGCPAFVLNRERYYGSTNYIFWDNGDYILGVYANLPLEETMRLAQSVAIDENALSGEEGVQ